MNIAESQASVAALAVSLITLAILLWQTRILRKTVETSNYQDLIGKVLQTRQVLIEDETIGSLFRANPTLKAMFKNNDLTPGQFFWILMFLTTWENFYQQRKKGLLDDVTWASYKSTMRTVMETPIIRECWSSFAAQGNYRSDWAEFVTALSDGRTGADPAPSAWKRILRVRG